MMRALRRRRCRRKGHDWLLRSEPMEFVVVSDICLRCGVVMSLLPWGECLHGHPIGEHYDEAGTLVAHPACPGPL